MPDTRVNAIVSHRYEKFHHRRQLLRQLVPLRILHVQHRPTPADSFPRPPQHGHLHGLHINFYQIHPLEVEGVERANVDGFRATISHQQRGSQLVGDVHLRGVGHLSEVRRGSWYVRLLIPEGTVVRVHIQQPIESDVCCQELEKVAERLKSVNNPGGTNSPSKRHSKPSQIRPSVHHHIPRLDKKLQQPRLPWVPAAISDQPRPHERVKRRSDPPIPGGVLDEGGGVVVPGNPHGLAAPGPGLAGLSEAVDASDILHEVGGEGDANCGVLIHVVHAVLPQRPSLGVQLDDPKIEMLHKIFATLRLIAQTSAAPLRSERLAIHVSPTI
mmetsp:Transcript_255/g.507  ORF Transcript_255/g.507 Transcript_255/m.507 type:complete len:328 (-) Transcript_255:24-1007(-)